MIERITRRKPIPRKSAPPKTNATRKAREFARCFHSKLRVEFVRRLPCVMCNRWQTYDEGSSDNAHISSGHGMTYRGDYTSIVPLCRVHHTNYDQRRPPFDGQQLRNWIEYQADETQAAWLRHCGEGE